MTVNDVDLDGRIAVIGMSGRFPGANDLETFWQNLRGGVEAVQYYSEDELLAAGESLENIRDPAYVPASAPLEGIDLFDAAFFGMSPRDAAVFDPQHRVFLECAWEAFEHAGYVGEQIEGSVGVFASCGLSEYMFKNVLANEQVKASVGEWLVRHTGNDTNFLATRVSYEFNLNGPSLNVQTACSSSLVALHLACQSLLSGECDMALAGGAVVAPVQRRGYFYREGEILSPDGHCRAFDEKSAGTIISSASGCVLLKPLADALADGDTVLAVIRGSAINNDGRDKVGYLAPSVSGQARVVTEALAVAGVDARDVTYVEAHGTGTLIGDPIEIAGLTQAYRQSTDDNQFCAIGSVKSNIGHAGEASGIASMIKTVLSLQHSEIPPSLHYQSPNPQADFPNSPFFVNGELRDWTVPRGRPRIAGITGLGAGGTNAHVLVEEAPEQTASGPSRSAHLLTVSARTASGLDRAASDLASFLRENPDSDLADVAFTRLAGRKAFRVRRAVVAANAESASVALESNDPKTVINHNQTGDMPSVVFMMPGGGAQYAGMGLDLYESEPVYRDIVDKCCTFINPRLGLDLRSVLFPDGDLDEGSRRLERPSVALPALFTTEYAMAKLLESWGIVPAAMIGHSAGEYVAACLSGVIGMEDGLSLVALRGRLFETLPPGGMLSVSLSETDVRERMASGLSIAAANAPSLCVVAGPLSLIDEMEVALNGDDVDCMRVHIDVAAHSSMLEPILAEFGAFCRTIRFGAPSIPYVSNLTGTWITEADVTDPNYWVRHLRESVRFGQGIETILSDPNRVLMEIGPGRTLASLARQAETKAVGITPTLRHPKEASSDVAYVLAALGRLWVCGVAIDPAMLYADETRKRVPLPTYPFERQRYWVEPDPVDLARPSTKGVLRKRHDVSDWFYTPSWKRSVVAERGDAAAAASTWLFIDSGAPLAQATMDDVRSAGGRVVSVTFGEKFQRLAETRYVVRPWQIGDWTQLIEELKDSDFLPDRIVHMTAIGPSKGRKLFGLADDQMAAFDATVESDHASLLFLAQALSGLSRPMRLAIVTSGVHAVGFDDDLRPERALLHGASRVIPRELMHIATIAIDIDLPARSSAQEKALLKRLVLECGSDSPEEVVAYRKGERWVRDFAPIHLPVADETPWRASGVYLITGGLGGIGLAIGEQIATHAKSCTLVLIGRTALPPEPTWASLLASDSCDGASRHKIEAIGRMKALGADVITASVDVTDASAVALLVADVQAKKGRITGVIHSAGVLHDALIALRPAEITSPVVDVKAKGVMVLERVLAKNPPDVIVLCSSVSSIIGLPGQVDYTAASAFLDAFAIKKNIEGKSRFISVNWNAWQEVGMAVDAIRETAERARPSAADSPVRLFDFVVDDHGGTVFSTAFSRERHWLLDEHVVRGGDALIPGTGYLEIIRSAAVKRAAAPGPVEIRDVYFLSPFVVGVDETRTLTVKLDQATSTVLVFSDSEDSPHVSASVQRVDPGIAQHLDLNAIRERCGLRVEEFDGYSDQPFMQFGPRWGNLRRVEYGQSEALITTIMPSEYVDELDSLWLHPAMVDMATGSAQALIPGFSPADSFFVPLSYARVLVRAPMPAHAVSHVRLRESSARDLAVFDITICEPDGSEVVSIEGFTMRRLQAGAQLTARRLPEERHTDAPVGRSSINAAVREGILPVEGVDALDRILAADAGAQVVASSVDLHQWIANVDVESIAAGADDGDGGESGGPQFERPNISSVFVAPATPIERELATIWRDLLGVDQVGRNDDFFELGGQSLVAVRLFTRMRKKFSVDLPLSTLFEASTIAQCAVVIAEAAGVDDAEAEPTTEARSSESSPRLRHKFLVSMNDCMVPGATPLFVVCGMKGNVLNFRLLAQKVARDRPFYGIQAQGLVGKDQPFDNFKEMAAAYLGEVRQVQPHGPYLLGGYSAGGVAAFEMAQQLRALGEQVDLLVLFDSWRPQAMQMTASERLRFHFHRLRATGAGYVKQWVIDRIEWERARRPNRGLTRDSVDELTFREATVMAAFSNAFATYVPDTYDGHVMLFRPPNAPVLVFGPDRQIDNFRRFMYDDGGWGEFGARVTVFEVPGDHDSMFVEPYVDTLASHLHDTLTPPNDSAPSPTTTPSPAPMTA